MVGSFPNLPCLSLVDVHACTIVRRSANYTKNGMRWKLLIAAAIIFCVWDWDLNIFEKV